VLTRPELVHHANRIYRKYRRMDLSLTLRQLYYQLVKLGLIVNKQTEYGRLGKALSKARLNGDFPLEGLVDRGRHVTPDTATLYSDDVDMVEPVAQAYAGALPKWLLDYGRWAGQEKYVCVLCEKEALAGVFQRPCKSLGVSFLACKGYPSISSLYAWVLQANQAINGGQWTDDRHLQHWAFAQRAVILYFGDLDPDGWAVPKVVSDRVGRIQSLTGMEFPVDVERVALNLDQIEDRGLPPFPAKDSSSRYKKYVQEVGIEDAWELDALDPPELIEMIQDAISVHFDEHVHAYNSDRIETLRDDLRRRMLTDGWLEDALGEE